MHEVHCPSINRDVESTEGGDGGGRDVESDEMHRHIAVIFEGGCDLQACGEITSGGVNQHVDLLTGISGKHIVNSLAVVISISAFEERTRLRRQSLSVVLDMA